MTTGLGTAVLRRGKDGVRSGLYLTSLLVTGMAAMVAVPLLFASALTTAMFGLGLVLFPLALYVIRTWGDWERRRAARQLGRRLPALPITFSGGPVHRVRQILTDRTTWRAVGWLGLHAIAGTVLGLIGLIAVFAIPLAPLDLYVELRAGVEDPFNGFGVGRIDGVLIAALSVPLLLWGTGPLARTYARVAVILLSPSEAELRAKELAERVDTLTETRAGAVNAHDAELRRIERDLHDGTQAQLVSIAIRLGLAERAITDHTDDPEAVARLIRDARSGAEEAMLDLRDVIRTMYPPILADRGLDGALAALAARCAVPTKVHIDELGKLPAPVEAAAYFVVAEALTNISKHSAATRADVRVNRTDDHRLLVEVTDDGVGGADPDLGTGIHGIRRRVAALDGAAQVSSPVGGPTQVFAELPCAS